MDDMTMGQRIAEQRKRIGLSQEALGEKTGVSRQAISKWEADGAVPEIDKLIALSKLYGVSVGWLLGVEAQPEKQNDELSDSQLKMVEEIVARYLAAQPAPQKRRSWLYALTTVIIIFVFISLFSRLDQLDNRYSSLPIRSGNCGNGIKHIHFIPPK